MEWPAHPSLEGGGGVSESDKKESHPGREREGE